MKVYVLVVHQVTQSGAVEERSLFGDVEPAA